MILFNVRTRNNNAQPYILKRLHVLNLKYNCLCHVNVKTFISCDKQGAKSQN